jgi:hypothetical protein
MALYRRTKNNNKPLLRQILDLIPHHLLDYQNRKHQSDKGCSKYKTYDQLVSLIFGQLNKCYSLASISIGLSVSGTFLNDIKLIQSPSKSTMSDGNKQRTYKVFEGLYFSLLSYYKSILKNKHQTHIIEEIKTHTVLDDSLGLPDVINISEAKTHDNKGLENNVFEKGTIIVEDRGYFDFSLMLKRILAGNFFVTRIKENTIYTSIKELDLPDKEDQDILKDEIIQLTSDKAKKTGINEHKMRLVTVYKQDENAVIHIITNNLEWKARTIADLYKKRWDIELFFKAMKQNLQIKTFVGTSENAVKSQIYIALITYLLLELIRRVYNESKSAFSVFCDKIRVCLMHYLTLNYVCNELKPIVRKAIKPPEKTLFPTDNFSMQQKLFT